jgi:hypothetical protein
VPERWHQITTIDPRSYVCGYCGDKVGPNVGYHDNAYCKIFICSSCKSPTYFDENGRQWPGVAFGAKVAALPNPVQGLYEEARRCMSVSAYTAAVMACRKLLMNIAVEKGAKEDQSFKHYVEWLVENHYVPPGSEALVEHIRSTGGGANHEIDLVSQAAAEEVMSFAELLLKFVYEFPARIAPDAGAGEAET